MLMGRPDIPKDPRFADLSAIRRNADALYQEMEKTMRTRTAAEWEKILGDAGIPAMRINTVPEAIEDPQIKSRGLYHVFDSIPGVDAKVTVPLTPYKLSDGGARIVSPPPLLGQNTDEILKGLGYREEDIRKLRDAGSI